MLRKPNKDPLECSNYRPILLLNIDLKLFTKVLANRLWPLLHLLIGPEQVGFMPGKEARDNVTKALNLIHRAHSDGFEGMLLSTDMEKAFNRISWGYLHATCDHIGLKPHILSWISTLYHNPMARIRVNGML